MLHSCDRHWSHETRDISCKMLMQDDESPAKRAPVGWFWGATTNNPFPVDMVVAVRCAILQDSLGERLFSLYYCKFSDTNFRIGVIILCPKVPQTFWELLTVLTCFMFLLSPTTFCCVAWRASTVWHHIRMTRNYSIYATGSTLLLFITSAVHETCFCCRSCNRGGVHFLIIFFLKEIWYYTIFVWIIFQYDWYFWQGSTSKWIYFPIPVHCNLFKKWQVFGIRRSTPGGDRNMRPLSFSSFWIGGDGALLKSLSCHVANFGGQQQNIKKRNVTHFQIRKFNNKKKSKCIH